MFFPYRGTAVGKGVGVLVKMNCERTLVFSFAHKWGANPGPLMQDVTNISAAHIEHFPYRINVWRDNKLRGGAGFFCRDLNLEKP